MAAPATEPVRHDALTGGRFVVDLLRDRWWWSDGLYRVLGYAADEVVPSSALVLEHTRPGCRHRWDESFERWRRRDEPVLVGLEMVDRHRQPFDAVVVGALENEPAGSASLVVDGYVIDLGHARLPAELAPVDPRIAEEVRVRETIDQAKGVVTAAFGTDAEMSFDLLREAAIRNAVPLRMLARHVVAEAAGVAPGEIEPWLRRLLSGPGSPGDGGDRPARAPGPERPAG
ncbi:ANTAR domain-containing protein [Cellulomonas sp. DKR-3]|uniref:ANTAR domain-containing protein n=1 Tax=Cellulomonas fulva TaxID=2835530 RepID=A0ABS5U0R0_9CELL|nr:ANTAR domain-containing protein [Cellulomonas fulva]MBT0994981.1 ANTAR domain-containing protein [Cellulomonas fulva]